MRVLEEITLIYRLWLLMRGSWGFWRSLPSLIDCDSSWGGMRVLEEFTLIYRLWLLMRGSWGFWRSLPSLIDCDSSWGGHEGSGGVYSHL
jgi:hypothetical protein